MPKPLPKTVRFTENPDYNRRQLDTITAAFSKLGLLEAARVLTISHVVQGTRVKLQIGLAAFEKPDDPDFMFDPQEYDIHRRIPVTDILEKIREGLTDLGTLEEA